MPYKDEGIVRVTSIADITTIKHSESALRMSEERFRKMFEASPIGIALLGKEREIILTNQRYRDFLGYTEAEIIERGPVGILHPDDWEPSMALSLKLRSGEIPVFRMEQRYIRKDGTIVWADTHITVLQDRDGQVILTIGWVQDITERKKAEEEKARLESRLLHAQKMEALGSLAGGIAHDLNNILFPIRGLSEMLLGEMAPDNPEFERIEQINKSAKRGSDLVKQILAFSRQSNVQKLPIRIQPILKRSIEPGTGYHTHEY